MWDGGREPVVRSCHWTRRARTQRRGTVARLGQQHVGEPLDLAAQTALADPPHQELGKGVVPAPRGFLKPKPLRVVQRDLLGNQLQVVVLKKRAKKILKIAIPLAQRMLLPPQAQTEKLGKEVPEVHQQERGRMQEACLKITEPQILKVRMPEAAEQQAAKAEVPKL